jgi:hypothetical protein
MYKIKKAAAYLVLLIFITYVCMMLIIPMYDGNFSWYYLQTVWSKWQTFNAAMIAFTSSIIALYVVRYREKKNIEIKKLNDKNELERNLFLSKALLPDALSELHELCENYYGLLECSINISDDELYNYIEGEIPSIPKWIILSLKECMTFSKMEDAIYIARLLSELQIVVSRLKSIHVTKNKKSEIISSVTTIERHILSLSSILSKLNRLFPYARMESELDKSNITTQELTTALLGINCTEKKHPNIYRQIPRQKFK